MTYKHYNAVVDRLPDGIETATERALFLDACYRADSKGILRMSQIELEKETLWSLATIKRIFGRLEEAGLLLRLAHGRYKVIVDTGAEISLLKAHAEPTSASKSKADDYGEEQERKLVLAQLNSYIKQEGLDIELAKRVSFPANAAPPWLDEAIDFGLLEFEQSVTTPQGQLNKYIISPDPARQAERRELC